MITIYLRSSSYSCHSWCPMKAYINYTLGWTGPGILAAHRGTIFHKVLQILGEIKLRIQNNESIYNDDICGEILVTAFNLDKITETVYKHYSSQLTDLKNREWTPKDLKDIKSWIDICLNYNNGILNPLNQNIFALEKRFDIEIPDDWASYDYKLGEERVIGKLHITGTIDNIIKINDNTLEILDYKSGGSRKDWSKNVKEVQEYDDFKGNFQLLLYKYAISILYPEYPNIITSIYYVRAGGLYTMFFNKEDDIKTKEMIKNKFIAMKNDDNPKTVYDWRCKSYCENALLDFSDTNVQPIKEFRRGKQNKVGEKMSRCDQTKFALEKRGIELVTENYKNPNNFLKYKAPGSV